MKHDKDDKKIEQLFHQLRQQDEQQTPSFERMWAKAARSRIETRWQPFPVFRFAVAFVLLLVVGGSTIIAYLQNRVDASRTSESIAQWQSPTRSLLELSVGKTPTRKQGLLAKSNSGEYIRALSKWQSPTASLGYPGSSR